MRLSAAAILLLALVFPAKGEASWIRAPTLFGPAVERLQADEFSDRKRTRKAHVRAVKRAVRAQAIITCDRQGCGNVEASSVGYAGTLTGYREAVASPARGSVSLSGVVAPLAAKAREIVSACGSKVISAVRHTRVRGSGRLSLHASGRAVDLSGNPACIYAHLKGWPGGVSTDYHGVRCGRSLCPHVHVSYSPGGAEWGKRFAHYGTRKNKRYRVAGAR
jgi:hypothetical protein